MTKDDLCTGDIVTLANSEKYIVILNFRDLGDIIIKIGDGIKWDNIKNYDKYLVHDNFSELDIMRIEKPEKQTSILKLFNYKDIDLVLLHERGKPRKMTIKEIQKVIQKELGYKVEIVE